MTWSYTPVATPKDMVRLLIGDTDTADPQLEDEEIAFLLTQNGVTFASANAAEVIAGRLARKVTTSVGTLKLELESQYTHYLKLAATLRAQGARNATPRAGGLTISDKDNLRTDDDAVQPAFTVDLNQTAGTDRRWSRDPSWPGSVTR